MKKTITKLIRKIKKIVIKTSSKKSGKIKKALIKKAQTKSKTDKKIKLKIKSKIGTKSKSGLKTKNKKIKKRVSFSGISSVVSKHEGNPIISPRLENKWESWQTFNPGVVLIDDKAHFLYRAIGEDGVSRLGYAVSGDGFAIDDRFSYPVYEHRMEKRVFNTYSYASGGGWGGAEDPRLVYFNDDKKIYMTYTACDNGLRVGLNSINADDFANGKWKWGDPNLISPAGELHKNWLIFPEKIKGKYAILLSIVPKMEIKYFDTLDFDEDFFINSSRAFGHQKNCSKGDCWDKWLRGAGAPPVKTKDGWLLFYHAMDDDQSKYKVGAMLLDLQNPSKILHRAKEPVLEPQEPYENCGSKFGVVYVSGVIVKDGKLLIYYGGSDSHVCVAYADLDEFLEALKKDVAPKLKLKTLKKK